jgi:ABC-2 type transport system ATP-binding protein
MSVIEVEGLTKVYTTGWIRRQKLLALDSLTLNVEQGHIFGFLGPNGAGKSTSIKILLGLVHPSRGKANLLGKPISDFQVRERIGYLPENPAFPTHLRAGEFLRLMAKVYRVPSELIDERVKEHLELVKLTDRSKSTIREFSRGMLQRLGIAQALVNKPDLVILDEPLNGLDPYGRRELKQIFINLQARGCTVFFSSHILSDVQDLCHEIAILNKGQLIAAGPTKELLKQQPDGDLESFFFAKVDENNRQRFGLTEAEKTLKTVRIEAQPDAVA